MTSGQKISERLIKKYPNRRLYDTQTSSYITLSDVKQLVLDNENFAVVDAKTSEDLTRSILLQIILEEESNGEPMFSSHALSQIIRYYGHAMQGMMGSYLEKNIQAFIEIQNKLAESSKGFYEGKPFSPEMWTQFMNVQGPMMQGHDEQLHRAEQEHVPANAGTDAEPDQEHVWRVSLRAADRQEGRRGEVSKQARVAPNPQPWPCGQRHN